MNNNFNIIKSSITINIFKIFLMKKIIITNINFKIKINNINMNLIIDFNKKYFCDLFLSFLYIYIMSQCLFKLIIFRLYYFSILKFKKYNSNIYKRVSKHNFS